MNQNILKELTSEIGKVGYLVLWLLGVPGIFLIFLWLILGNNIFGPG